MKRLFWAPLLVVVLACGCEQKPPAAAPTEAAATADGKPKHIDTNREAFQAAGRAAKEIEKKEAEHNARADEAMNAGK